MAYIKRYLQEKIEKSLGSGQVVIVFGARQVGKTTLVRMIMKKYKRALYLSGDLLEDHEVLDTPSRAMVAQFDDLELLVIDEAQRIEDIGLKLKVLHDLRPTLRVLVTGSSALEVANKVNEPLTGRFVSYVLYPIAAHEVARVGAADLPRALVYGSYPAIVTCDDARERRERILNIASNYLFKDVLTIEYIQNARSLQQLVRLIAEQLGSEVSMNELSNTLDIDHKTVVRYLDILEKLYVVFPLHPYAMNVRRSLTKKRKYYFYDLGIRNAVVRDFRPLQERPDIGGLWENFCIVERMKRNDALDRSVAYHFWRSYKGEEIDLVEIENKRSEAFECKWNKSIVSPHLQKIFAVDLKGEGMIRVLSHTAYAELWCQHVDRR